MKEGLDKRLFYPMVYQAVPTDNFEVYAYCNDGAVRFFDVKPLLKSGTVFEPLKDSALFKEKITIRNHTVAWDLDGSHSAETCIDLDPFVIFEARRVRDPLEEEGPA